MKLGEVFESRYQIVAKLGYDTGSTVWSSWDLTYVTRPFLLRSGFRNLLIRGSLVTHMGKTFSSTLR